MAGSRGGGETSAGGMTDPEPAKSALLELRDIVLAYGRNRVVDGVNLTISENELVCLLGPSGCGKTSTLRIAAGVERQTSGSVFFDGVEISGGRRHDPPESRQIGLMFQDFALFPHMTVLANVGFGLKRLERTERRRKSQEALDRLGIGHLSDAYPHMLSGGEQQRVALCRALAPNPRIMLMDEPFSGLDRGLRNAVREDTRHTLAQEGASGLLVTHDAEEAMHIADRIVLMRQGKFVQFGTPSEIYRHPIDLESAELFSEINKLKASVEGGSVKTPLGSFKAPGFAQGAPVWVAMRHSDFTTESHAAGADCYSLPVTIRGIRFLGRDYMVEFEIGDGAYLLKARLGGPLAASPGDHLKLEIPTDKVLIFKR